jgi:Flp pilus assembly protein TadG
MNDLNQNGLKMRPGKQRIRRFGMDTTGAAAVEFALVSSLLLLLFVGIIDFGHAWYMRQVITNASREGARYGIIYRTDANGNRIAASALSRSISSYLLNDYKLTSILPADASPNITPRGAGYTSTQKGDQLEVEVTATKTWFIVSSFVPGLGNSLTLKATTVMLIE